PDTVTGTILPFGGHKNDGVTETVITGGVVQKDVLFNSTSTVPGVLIGHEFATSKSGPPSPLTSAKATDSAPPTGSNVPANWKVPSPLPSKSPTMPFAHLPWHPFATATSRFPSPFTSATAIVPDA